MKGENMNFVAVIGIVEKVLDKNVTVKVEKPVVIDATED
jgi:hypothetical protein